MDIIQKKLREENVDFIRTIWCDNANVIRGKAFHIDKLKAYYQHGVGISYAQQAVPVMYDVPIKSTGLGPVGEVRLVPDWSTLKTLPYYPTHARVIGDMISNGKPWSFCPRNFLKKMLKFAEKNGIEIEVGFENEFYLLNPACELAPVDRSLFASTSALDRSKDILNEITNSLSNQSISVELLHSEAGPGQFEVSLTNGNPLKMADQQLVFRETVKAVSFLNELQATFIPKPFEDKAGAGMHIHISLWENGKNITPRKENKQKISEQTSQFIAGILDHLPALMAVTTPSTNSYKRIQPKAWSGAFQIWGYDNREAAIRIPTTPRSKGITNFELKTLDSSANPYLAIGAIIAAGLDGIKKKTVLSDAVNIDPGTLSDKERSKKKVRPLVHNLGEAIKQFESSSMLQDTMGNDLYMSYLAVKKAEWDTMKDMTHEEEVNMLLDAF